jgi:hypothetical protein
MLAILGWLNSCFSWLYTLFGWMLDGLLEVLNFFLYTFVDGILTIVLTFINSLNFASLLFNMATYWGLMPSQGLYLVDQLGITTGLSMLGVAYTIRVMLNFVPSIFTRI